MWQSECKQHWWPNWVLHWEQKPVRTCMRGAMIPKTYKPGKYAPCVQDKRESGERPEERLYDASGGGQRYRSRHSGLTTVWTPQPSSGLFQFSSAHRLHTLSVADTPCVLASYASGSFHSTKYASSAHAQTMCTTGISFWRSVFGFGGAACEGGIMPAAPGNGNAGGAPSPPPCSAAMSADIGSSAPAGSAPESTAVEDAAEDAEAAVDVDAVGHQHRATELLFADPCSSLCALMTSLRSGRPPGRLSTRSTRKWTCPSAPCRSQFDLSPRGTLQAPWRRSLPL